MESTNYVIGYVNDKSERVCELFPDWPSLFKRYGELDSLSKTAYTVVQGKNERTS